MDAQFGDASPPVDARPEVLDRLRDYADKMTDAVKLGEIAAANGVSAPDDRPGWMIVSAYADGAPGPTLYWLHPDDEPDTQVD